MTIPKRIYDQTSPNILLTLFFSFDIIGVVNEHVCSPQTTTTKVGCAKEVVGTEVKKNPPPEQLHHQFEYAIERGSVELASE